MKIYLASSLHSDELKKRIDRKGFGRFHPLGWNSKKPKVFNFQATNLIIKNDLSWT